MSEAVVNASWEFLLKRSNKIREDLNSANSANSSPDLPDLPDLGSDSAPSPARAASPAAPATGGGVCLEQTLDENWDRTYHINS